MKAPTVTTSTGYRVAINGDCGYFDQSGYSEYYSRLTLSNEGKLPEGESVYGFAQALDHINELRQSVYHGVKSYKDADFVIRIVTHIETQIHV